ncbi:MAG: nucleotidyl transferase AbiEii/AbiGii toxin family protein [Spirochaeta sp.]|jgi:predicted nucleotidyltransferase component of viral defense system|nr:nucleotidyl transferase AbiEii/AbiGii toxin family protein [Spirochaeta sp.]
MNLFDTLVEDAISAQPGLKTLRPAVEKEILHHDVLRIMSRAGYLNELVFIGGTCLRNIYGSVRLSEDLDVTVTEPVRDAGDTDTWKIRIITRPERPDLPMQKIHLDICSRSSYDARPATIMQHYNMDMGTAGLILNAESRQEILADKIVALALRRSRIKYRDVWDILFLLQRVVPLDPSLVYRKIDDRQVDRSSFRTELKTRIAGMQHVYAQYQFELRRFLPSNQSDELFRNPGYWDYVHARLTEIADDL